MSLFHWFLISWFVIAVCAAVPFGRFLKRADAHDRPASERIDGEPRQSPDDEWLDGAW